MKYEVKTYTLQKLADAYPKFLPINREYQRGPKWKKGQNQALMDSLLKGYRLPLFYVHLVDQPDPFGEGVRVTRFLVDGQQRLEAIKRYMQNAFALADPQSGRPSTVGPTLTESPDSWAGKKWDELSKEDQQRLLDQEMLVMEMREERENEVRELFIRLQSGTPLTPQEKRDAWPGDFTEFVIRSAGKPDTEVGNNPHKFFELVPRRLGPRRRVFGDDEEENYVDGLVDARKFFAGLAMTIMRRQRDGVDFVDLKGKTLSDFYMANLRLAPDDPAKNRVVATLDCVAKLPRFSALVNGPKLKFNMAFHLVLLADTLNNGDYTDTWTADLITAFQAFQDKVAQARVGGGDAVGLLLPYERFAARLSGGGSDTAVEIRRRHAFFLDQMYRSMRIELKDPNRHFDAIEREVIWNRDRRKCQNPDCNNYQETSGEVPFRDATVHHVREHCAGGATRLENGVLVCCVCHRDRELMLRLAPRFQEYLRAIYAGQDAQATDRTTAATPATAKTPNKSGAVEKQGRRRRGRRGGAKLKIVIRWRRLGVDRDDRVIEEAPNEAVVQFLSELLAAPGLGDSIRRQLTRVDVIRTPLSDRPDETFINNKTGEPYNYLPVGDTGLFLCPHSGNPEKVRRLRVCVENLTLSDGNLFPEGSVEFSLVENPAGGIG